MANSLYDKGRQGFLEGTIPILTANIKLVFIDEADDTIDLVNDNALDDRAVASRVATSGNLASKTSTDGVFDAADTTVSTVTGDQFESIDFYEDSGTESTSELICNVDTATGLPCTPNGGNITVQYDAGANRIFKL